MKAFAEKFYKSKQWQKLSRLYLESKHFVCERCGGVATICHHKIYLQISAISIFRCHLRILRRCVKIAITRNTDILPRANTIPRGLYLIQVAE